MEPMPDEIHEKAALVRRYANFLGDAVLVGLIAVLALRNSIGSAQLGLKLEHWEDNGAAGIAAGLLLVVVQGLIAQLVRVDAQNPFTYSVRRRSLAVWLLIFLAGAFSEELWIALCVVAFRSAGHAAVTAVATTAIVFAAVHYGYGFGAVIAGVKGAISALLFLHYGSLIVLFSFHFVGNLGSLYWNRYWRR